MYRWAVEDSNIVELGVLGVSDTEDQCRNLMTFLFTDRFEPRPQVGSGHINLVLSSRVVFTPTVRESGPRSPVQEESLSPYSTKSLL